MAPGTPGAIIQNMPALLCPDLIGRSEELTELRDLLEETQRGNGSFALISGEAGVGKSRFVAAALQDLGTPMLVPTHVVYQRAEIPA